VVILKANCRNFSIETRKKVTLDGLVVVT